MVVILTNDVKIEVDEVNLEDLIILGEDKLFNISIEYPEETDDGLIKIVRTKDKINQLTIKELKNIDINNVDINNVANIRDMRDIFFECKNLIL